MTGNTTSINIGTPERPMWVSGKALEPKTSEGREWWEEVASGSIVLEPEVLDKLLELHEDQENS